MQQVFYGATVRGHANTGNAASTFPQRSSRWQDRATCPLPHWEATAHHLRVTGVTQALSWKNGLRTAKDLLQEQEEGLLWSSPAGIPCRSSTRLWRRDSCLLSCLLGWAHLYLSHHQSPLQRHTSTDVTGLEEGLLFKIHVVSACFS